MIKCISLCQVFNWISFFVFLCVYGAFFKLKTLRAIFFLKSILSELYPINNQWVQSLRHCRFVLYEIRSCRSTWLFTFALMCKAQNQKRRRKTAMWSIPACFENLQSKIFTWARTDTSRQYTTILASNRSYRQNSLSGQVTLHSLHSDCTLF